MLRLPLLCLLASLACAEFFFPDFSPASIHAEYARIHQPPLQFLKFNGSDATFVPMFPISPSSALCLTHGTDPSQSFAMWYSQPQYVVDGFVATFEWNATEDENYVADGLAFVIQDMGLGGAEKYNPLGAAGNGIGYAGIPRSIAIEFDMYLDPDVADPNSNHISAHSRGLSPNNADERRLDIRGSLLPSDPQIQIDPLNNPTARMDNGIHKGQLRYIVSSDPALTRIEVAMDGRVVPALTVHADLAALLQLVNGTAYIGITSSTNDQTSHDLQIRSWSFANPRLPSTLPDSAMSTTPSSDATSNSDLDGSSDATWITSVAGLPPLAAEVACFAAGVCATLLVVAGVALVRRRLAPDTAGMMRME